LQKTKFWANLPLNLASGKGTKWLLFDLFARERHSLPDLLREWYLRMEGNSRANLGLFGILLKIQAAIVEIFCQGDSALDFRYSLG
jgi:hypothetical protein